MIVKKIDNTKREEIDKALKLVFDALNTKGYEPIEQIRSYLLSEDPVYITNYNNARSVITALDVEDIQRYLLELYFNV